MARWCALKVRVDCPECGSAVLVDGPYKSPRCPACDAKISLAGIWKSVVDRTLESGSGGRHFKPAVLAQLGVGSIGSIYVGMNKGGVPVCSQCDALLEAVESVADGTDGEFHCSACGAAHPTWPAPGYLRQAKVLQVFMAPPEAEPAKAEPPTTDVRPVNLSCTNCGAKLKITTEAKRVFTCEYCDVDSYLPADLWNTLHPVRRRRAFWLRVA